MLNPNVVCSKFRGFNIKKRSKGHAFVVMPDADAGHAAIAALTGQTFMGRPIDISIRVFNPDSAVQNLPRPLGLGQPIKPR